MRYVGGSSPRGISFLKRKKISGLDIDRGTRKLLHKEGIFNLYELYEFIKKVESEQFRFYYSMYGLKVLCVIDGIGTRRIKKVERAIRKLGLNPALFSGNT